MSKECKNITENIVEYLELVITFPSLDTDDDSLFIYKKTIEQLSRIETQEILLHVGKDASLYHTEIDYLLCNSNEKKLDFPEIKLIYKHQELHLPDISIMTKILFPKFYFYSSDKSWLNIQNAFINMPPCSLDKLKIVIIGDFVYYDINRPSKIFNILDLK